MKKILLFTAALPAISAFMLSCGGRGKTQAEIQDSIRLADSIQMAQSQEASPVLITDAVCDTMKTTDGKMVEVTYGTLGGRRVAVLSHSNFVPNDTLPQTNAWAKGAEYEKGGVKLHSQGDKAKLHTPKGMFDLTVERKK